MQRDKIAWHSMAVEKRSSRRYVSSVISFYHVHVAMKALEQLSGRVRVRLWAMSYLRAASSCTCYGKLTHKGHAYVYDNTMCESETALHKLPAKAKGHLLELTARRAQRAILNATRTRRFCQPFVLPPPEPEPTATPPPTVPLASSANHLAPSPPPHLNQNPRPRM